MLIVYWPIKIMFRIRKQTSKPQTKYRCCLQFSQLAPYWLISRNTITFHKYFWCSRFCEFHSKCCCQKLEARNKLTCCSKSAKSEESQQRAIHFFHNRGDSKSSYQKLSMNMTKSFVSHQFLRFLGLCSWNNRISPSKVQSS